MPSHSIHSLNNTRGEGGFCLSFTYAHPEVTELEPPSGEDYDVLLGHQKCLYVAPLQLFKMVARTTLLLFVVSEMETY